MDGGPFGPGLGDDGQKEQQQTFIIAVGQSSSSHPFHSFPDLWRIFCYWFIQIGIYFIGKNNSAAAKDDDDKQRKAKKEGRAGDCTTLLMEAESINTDGCALLILDYSSPLICWVSFALWLQMDGWMGQH